MKMDLEAMQLLNTLKREGLRPLSAEQRRRSKGRIGREEEAALSSLIDVVAGHMQHFSTPTRTGLPVGHPQTVERARNTIARRRELARTQATLAEAAQLVADELLSLGAELREITTPAYGLARVHSRFDPQMKITLATVLNFYGATSKRRRLKQAPVHAHPPTPPPAPPQTSYFFASTGAPPIVVATVATSAPCG